MNRAAAALLAVSLLAGCAAPSRESDSEKSPSPRRSATFVWESGSDPNGPTAAASPSPAGRDSYSASTVRTHRPKHRKPPPDAKLLAPYAWADTYRDPIENAASFTLVKGIGPRAALHVLDPHPATPVWTPHRVDRWVDHAPYTDSHYYQAIYAGRRDGWTFVLEDNGFRATQRAARLSRHGAAVVIFNNVNALCSFHYAAHGRVIRDFDPSFYVGERRRALPQERGIKFGHDWRYIARSMLLAHRLTGLRLTLADVQPGRYSVAIATRY